jgi:shikimate kinase
VTRGVAVNHIVLVGLMGSGKSTVGARLAAATDRRFVDLDDAIEAEAGLTIPEIFELEGEAGFRAREHEAMAAVLAATEPLVLATGGGAVLRPANRDLMREHGVVVWLRATPATLAARVGDGAGRPLLASPVAGDDVEGRLTALSADRAEAYEAAAHETVDVDGADPDEIVAVVTSRLRAY